MQAMSGHFSLHRLQFTSLPPMVSVMVTTPEPPTMVSVMVTAPVDLIDHTLSNGDVLKGIDR